MSNASLSELLPGSLRDHVAVVAWSQLGLARSKPDGIEILKQKKGKSQVYRLAGAGPNGTTIIAKRCPAVKATLERLVHEELSRVLGLPTLRLFGAVPEAEGDCWWLFLEDAGAETYCPADREHRNLAARWLATVHQAHFPAGFAGMLPARDGAHYLSRVRWVRERLEQGLSRAALDREQTALLRGVVTTCRTVERHRAELDECCGAWPSTLVHGDFVLKNLRVRPGAGQPALLVFDWEMGGWGARATDLANNLERTASPDLQTYWSALREQDQRVRLRDVQRLGACGDLLRVLDEIFWEAESMADNTFKVLLKPITTIQTYEPQLAAAMRTLEWS